MIATDRNFPTASQHAGSFTLTPTGGDPAAGSTIIVVTGSSNSSGGLTVTDNVPGSPNTYVQDFYSTDGAGTYTVVFRATNISLAGLTPGTFALTVNTGAGYVSAGAESFTGLANSSPVDGSGSTATGAGSVDANTGALTTTNAVDLIIVAQCDDGGGSTSYSEPTGFTNFARQSSGAIQNLDAAYKIVAATQPGVTYTWNNAAAASWNALAWALKAAAAASFNAGRVSQSNGIIGTGVY